jgi:hypothetical protein
MSDLDKELQDAFIIYHEQAKIDEVLHNIPDGSNLADAVKSVKESILAHVIGEENDWRLAVTKEQAARYRSQNVLISRQVKALMNQSQENEDA